MRVISGSAKGMPLCSPSDNTRPTKDHVREAVFNILHHATEWPDLRILDLFAGSGAMGIEALSRGAGSALFVEEDRHAAKCIERNLAGAKLEGTVRQADTFRLLGQLAASGRSFDLIFADPPYVKKEGDRDFAAELLVHEDLAELAGPGAFFVLETKSDAELPDVDAWELLDRRAYGTTLIHFYRLKSS